MRSIAIGLISGALSLGAQVRTSTIPEAVRRDGNIEIVLSFQREPAQVADLATKSAVIAHVVVRSERSRLTPDNASVVTDYGVDTIAVIKNSLPDPLKSTFTVTRLGGTIVVEGRTVRAFEPGFDSFKVGSEYLLCLASTHADAFAVIYGGQGAFEIEGTSARQMTRYLNLLKGKDLSLEIDDGIREKSIPLRELVSRLKAQR
jgi:hypothetical protein